jgi:hypothetical protein
VDVGSEPASEHFLLVGAPLFLRGFKLAYILVDIAELGFRSGIVGVFETEDRAEYFKKQCEEKLPPALCEHHYRVFPVPDGFFVSAHYMIEIRGGVSVNGSSD